MNGSQLIATPGSGQTIIKQESGASELKQVIDSAKWGTLCGAGIVAAFILEGLLWGPLMGLLFGLVVAVVGFAVTMRQAIGRRWPYEVQAVIALAYVGILVAWVTIGYDWLVAIWIPWSLNWWLWLEVSIDAVLWILRFFLGWVCWRLWSEIVDPHGPSSPRVSIVRDKMVYPWAPETFGGTVAAPAEQEERKPDASTLIAVPPVVLMGQRGRPRDLGVPPLADANGAWKLLTYLRALKCSARGFSRRGATGAGLYTRNEWHALEEWAIDAGFHTKGSGSLNADGMEWVDETIARLMPLSRSPLPGRAGGQVAGGGVGAGRAGPGQGSATGGA